MGESRLFYSWRYYVRCAAIALSISACAVGTELYRYDDGTVDSAITPASGTGSIFWMNAFQVVAGAETITDIRLAYGFGEVPPGLAVTVYLWTDPDNDGIPVNAVVVRSVSATTLSTGRDAIVTHAIAPVTLPAGSWFFAGALFTNPGSQVFVAASDETPPSAGNSWSMIFLGPPDPNNLGGADFFRYDASSDWMVRAGAMASIPEPSSVASVVSGAAGLAAAASWRKKRASIAPPVCNA